MAGNEQRDIANAKTELASTSYDSTIPGLVDLDVESLCDETFAERYEYVSKLGEGGMGEVRLCRDLRIGRDIAIKLSHAEIASRAEVRARFLREARVQGQLEHPAVVPVYDLGIDPDGQLFFTMQPVRGRTLQDVLESLYEGDEETRRLFSRRKLLEKMAGVCLALDFVHQRGVIHRDLKPNNLMLGSFGEAYLLDWGLAKFTRADDLDAPLEASSSPAKDTLRTRLGDVYGTPGYMAPEQLAGKPVDARADVYALGVILHQVLTSGSPDEIPPELEEACRKATAEDPEERFASARELAESIDRYLDGDRDLQLRRALAAERADRAADRLDAALSDAPDAERARSESLREVAGALALDPDNERARATLVRLLVEPPARMPDEAKAELARANQEHDRVAARGAAHIYLGSALLYALLVAWMGVRDWAWAAVTLGSLALAGFLSWQHRRTRPRLLMVLAASFVGIVGMSRMFGPFVLVPTFALGNTLGFALTPHKKLRTAFIAVGCLSFLLPAALEPLGVLEHSYRIAGGVITVLPQMHGFPPFASAASLIVITVLSMVGAALFVGNTRDALASAERRLHLHAWQLRRMVPEIHDEGQAGRKDSPVRR